MERPAASPPGVLPFGVVSSRVTRVLTFRMRRLLMDGTVRVTQGVGGTQVAQTVVDTVRVVRLRGLLPGEYVLNFEDGTAPALVTFPAGYEEVEIREHDLRPIDVTPAAPAPEATPAPAPPGETVPPEPNAIAPAGDQTALATPVPTAATVPGAPAVPDEHTAVGGGQSPPVATDVPADGQVVATPAAGPDMPHGENVSSTVVEPGNAEGAAAPASAPVPDAAAAADVTDPSQPATSGAAPTGTTPASSTPGPTSGATTVPAEQLPAQDAAVPAEEVRLESSQQPPAAG